MLEIKCACYRSSTRKGQRSEGIRAGASTFPVGSFASAHRRFTPALRLLWQNWGKPGTGNQLNSAWEPSYFVEIPQWTHHLQNKQKQKWHRDTLLMTAPPDTLVYMEESVETRCFWAFPILEDAILQYSWLKVLTWINYVHIKLAKTSTRDEITYLQPSHSWNFNPIWQVEFQTLRYANMLDMSLF